MEMLHARPHWPDLSRARRSRARAFSLVEVMVSLGVLVIASVASMLSFMMLNRYSTNLRNLSSAKELCQERIEQARTMNFAPPVTAPCVPGQDGKYYYILGMPTSAATVPSGVTTVPASGTTTDFSTAAANSGQFTGGSAQTTLVEPVTLYTPRDGTPTTAVTGTRTTTVSLSPLNDATTTSASLKLVQFTVTVAYTYRGQNFTYSMYTLRGPD